MATSVHRQVSFTDDLSNVEGVTFAQEDGKKIDAGANLTSAQAVRIVLTDGESVWPIDTARQNPVVALLKAQGQKQKKRGRKTQS